MIERDEPWSTCAIMQKFRIKALWNFSSFIDRTARSTIKSFSLLFRCSNRRGEFTFLDEFKYLRNKFERNRFIDRNFSQIVFVSIEENFSTRQEKRNVLIGRNSSIVSLKISLRKFDLLPSNIFRSSTIDLESFSRKKLRRIRSIEFFDFTWGLCESLIGRRTWQVLTEKHSRSDNRFSSSPFRFDQILYRTDEIFIDHDTCQTDRRTVSSEYLFLAFWLWISEYFQRKNVGKQSSGRKWKFARRTKSNGPKNCTRSEASRSEFGSFSLCSISSRIRSCFSVVFLLKIRELVLDNCARCYSIEGLTEDFCNLRVLSIINVGLQSLAKFPKLPKLREVKWKKTYFPSEFAPFSFISATIV